MIVPHEFNALSHARCLSAALIIASQGVPVDVNLLPSWQPADVYIKENPSDPLTAEILWLRKLLGDEQGHP